MLSIDEEMARDLAYGGALAMQEVSQHRWHTTMLVVFEHEDQLMGFYFYEPATEMQEGGDEFEAIPVPIFPVIAREVVTTIYEPTKELE